MERRKRTDGYAYCKHCSYSATVFEPLTKCCKCGIPAAYSEDSKGNIYCKKHYRYMPKRLMPEWKEIKYREFLTRKLKKQMKYGASVLIYGHKHGKIKCSQGAGILLKFIGNGKQITPVFRKQKRQLIQIGKKS